MYFVNLALNVTTQIIAREQHRITMFFFVSFIITPHLIK